MITQSTEREKAIRQALDEAGWRVWPFRGAARRAAHVALDQWPKAINGQPIRFDRRESARKYAQRIAKQTTRPRGIPPFVWTLIVEIIIFALQKILERWARQRRNGQPVGGSFRDAVRNNRNMW